MNNVELNKNRNRLFLTTYGTIVKFYCYFIDSEDTPEEKHQLTDKDAKDTDGNK